METKDILQVTETDFEKAWEEFGNINPHIAVSRRTARFFFFSGTQAGLTATQKLYTESFDRLQANVGKVFGK